MADLPILKIIKIAAITFSVVSIIGNALVCHVIVRLKTMKTSINYIILNLAILDATSGFLTINFVVLNDKEEALSDSVLPLAFNRSAVLADVLCRVNWLYWFSTNITPLLLVAMAYERYKAIVHPFSRLQSRLTNSRIKVLLDLSWLFGIGCSAVDLIAVKYDAETAICLTEDNSWYKVKLHFAFYLVTAYIIPSISMFICYFRVICALRKQDIEIGPQAEAERARRKTRKKVMWSIIVVTLVFYIFCGIPQIAIAFASFNNTLYESMLILGNIFPMMFSINSAFNPFVYFTFMQSFRSAFKKLFLSKVNSSNSYPWLERHRPSFHSENLSRGEQSPNNTEPRLLSFASKI